MGTPINPYGVHEIKIYRHPEHKASISPTPSYEIVPIFNMFLLLTRMAYGKTIHITIYFYTHELTCPLQPQDYPTSWGLGGYAGRKLFAVMKSYHDMTSSENPEGNYLR